MYNVFLDTNIYRGLGLRFARHRDYEHLKKFLELGGNELGIIKVVEQELFDYYNKDVFGKLFADYRRAVKNINDSPYMAKLPVVDFTMFEQEALKSLSMEMSTSMELNVESIPSDLLTAFLLDNKVEKRGDNARDFLIFYNLLMASVESRDETYVLISKDRIFHDNSFFKLQLETYAIDNLRIYESIPAFLSEVGLKIDWLTIELISKEVDVNVIEEEISNDVTCLPGYISKYYLEKDGEDLPLIQRLTIKDYRVIDFYLDARPNSGELMVNVDVAVSLEAIFGLSPDPEGLRLFLAQKPLPTISSPEKYDPQGHLVYDEDILFLFEGKVDQEHKVIRDLRFVDFFPSYFRYDNFQLGPAFQLLPIDPKQLKY